MRPDSGKLKAIYLYAISFATLMMMIFGVVHIAQQAASLAYGAPDYSPGPLDIKMRYLERIQQDDGQHITEDLIMQQAIFEAERSRRNRMYSEIRDLAKSIALLMVAFPVYRYHWNRAKDLDRASSAKDNGA